MSAVAKRIDPKPTSPVQLPELPIGMVAADHAAANDDGADVTPLAKKESLFKRGLRGIFQMAATGGATLLVKGVATSVLMGSSVPALAIMAGSVAATSITGSLITTYFHQRREHCETGANTKSFRQVFARKLMISAAISTATLGAVHNWASISSCCDPAFNAAARFAQPMLEHSMVQNVLNTLGNVAQRTVHALAQYSPLRFAHADDAGSLGYGPRALEQPTYGSGPSETVSGAGELKMYVPPVDEGEGEIDLLKLYRHTPPSAPPAAAELPPIELESYHAGDAIPAPEGIAVDAPPIAPMDVKSQVQELLDSGHLDRKTAQAAKALLKNPENGQRLKDFAHFLLNKEHNPQKALEFYHLAAEAGNKQAIADLAYLESKGIGLPAQPAVAPSTTIAASGSPQPGFEPAGEVKAEWAHSGEPLPQATAPAPTEAPSVPHGKLAAECHLSPMQLHPNHDGTKNVIIENINCKIYNQTMMPGQKVLVTTYQAGSQDFELDRSGSSNTLAFLTGSQHPTILTATDSRTSRLGFAVDKLTRIWKSAMIESQNVVAGFGTKFSFGPIGPAFN